MSRLILLLLLVTPRAYGMDCFPWKSEVRSDDLAYGITYGPSKQWKGENVLAFIDGKKEAILEDSHFRNYSCAWWMNTAKVWLVETYSGTNFNYVYAVFPDSLKKVGVSERVNVGKFQKIFSTYYKVVSADGNKFIVHAYGEAEGKGSIVRLKVTSACRIENREILCVEMK